MKINLLRRIPVLLAAVAGPAWAQNAVPPPPPAPEDWAVHFQSTGAWFLQPGFAAPYTGPQSLIPSANGRETFDATLFLGLRPWQGGELWFNPEIDQGFGLRNTFGVAGFVSGEAYKVGAQDPFPDPARLPAADL